MLDIEQRWNETNADTTETDTIKLRVDVCTEKIGSTVWDIIDTEILAAEWDAMTPEQQQEHGTKAYREWMFEQLEGGWKVER
ncbi:DUF7167 family protein [Planomonospora algeriensis]